ncbi:MBL fold metallo-hydrolase [Desulfopila aestuarii]|uniref:Metallo-beta-lactamase superfamily protein n=1 Tax=Desulfopila aestuarii DSM 18488 TaxID=1121416 RepID=A0A1M7XXT8_9BACT|nr:MBL fold metallo-hydrolase [Desulfopila aestuarii]SHO43769.1 Metallo-beta-lactamase superfamily protein [Desulfopila aestuarii DSM 18488]
MKKKTLGLLAVSLCLSWGFSMSAVAQDPAKIWLRQGPNKLLDSDAIMAKMDMARDLAGYDYYLSTLQRLQCQDIDETYTIVQTPGVNMGAWKEVPAEPTQVFDNVYYVGGMEVGGWIIDTGEGLIMLDSSYEYGATTILEPNIAALGLNPADIKYILVTHAGPDHFGAVMHFVDNYGTKVVFNRQLAGGPANPPWLQVVPEDMVIMGDGDKLTLGNTTITAVHTPRSYNADGITPGDGLSYFIPVKINGKRHLWATYGNTGLVGTVADKVLYRESMAKWLKYVDALKPDIAISSHPFVDASLDRMEIIRECNDRRGQHKGWNKQECSRNPFVIGRKAARRYFEIMDQCAVVQTMRQEAGINSTGLEELP